MATTTALTIEQFLAIPDPPDGGHLELSEGELITAGSARFLHEYVKAKMNERLVLWNAQSNSGFVFGESMFRLADATLRQADVAFVRKERFSNTPDGLIAFVPNLAVEVISESESAVDAEKKVQEYLGAGVDELWQVYPGSRLVHVRTNSGIHELKAEDFLEIPALPGFRVRTGEFFE